MKNITKNLILLTILGLFFLTGQSVFATTSVLPTAITNEASGVGIDSATLHGFFISGTTSSVIYWFEYGTTTSLGKATTPKNVLGIQMSSGPMKAWLKDLKYDTKYYFRAIIQNEAGITKGSLLTFTTGVNINNSIFKTDTKSDDTNNNENNENNSGFSGTNDGSSDDNGNNGLTATVAKAKVKNNGFFPDTLIEWLLFILLALILIILGRKIYLRSRKVIVTLGAEETDQTSGILTARYNAGESGLTTWFEYGTEPSLGNTTNSSVQKVEKGEFGEIISDLNPNTLYYFRAVAQNEKGLHYGNIISFYTKRLKTVSVPEDPIKSVSMAERIKNKQEPRSASGTFQRPQANTGAPPQNIPV